jgi:hypothetical protein
VHIKRIWAPIIVGLLLLMLILPPLVLADGPVISGVAYTINEPTAANITWTTNNISDSRVKYGTTPTPGSVVNTAYNASYVTNHLIRLEGLTPDTTYYFEVESTNASGTSVDNNSGAYYSFTTTPPPVGYYSITLDPVCGVCGEIVEGELYCNEVIGVTAIVGTGGTYYICWDVRDAAHNVGTFTISGAGSYTLTFFLPEAVRGSHNVYLTRYDYTDPAAAGNTYAPFVVNPSVKIDHEKGVVGTSVTLNGYGFTPSQQLQVKFNDTVIPTSTSLTPNLKGSWNFTYTIPDTPGGGYAFEVDANEAGLWVNWVSKSFKVMPSITVTPTLGTVGQTIAVNGKGFASNEKGIEVIFDGKVVSPYIPPANGNGTWNAVITVPPRTCGSYSIGASGTLTRARDVDPVEFTVVAGISVDPISAHVGDTINVTGGGFVAGETGIQVRFDGIVVSPSTITARLNGCWESSFTLPISTYGIHTVSATGDTTTAVRAANLTTQAKIIATSSDNGAPGDLISLTGNGYHGSQTLTVTIGGTAASGSMSTQLNGNVVISFRVPAGSTEGPLVVTDAGGASASVNFTVTKKTLSITPLPISPQNSTLRSGQVTFQWQGVTNVTGYTYTLEISQTAGFATTIFPPKEGIEGSSYTLHDTGNVTETLQKGTYYWRVKIVDNYGNEGPWSDSIKFTVSPIPTWVWVVVGLVVLIVLMVVAYRETKFKVTE